jgi:hypothetical protein
MKAGVVAPQDEAGGLDRRRIRLPTEKRRQACQRRRVVVDAVERQTLVFDEGVAEVEDEGPHSPQA